MTVDDANIVDAVSSAWVDERNAAFYGRFPFPWEPQYFVRYEDPDFWRRMVNQELGCFGRGPLAPGMKIWVAGCGTNQAVQTALRFPDAQVYATDVSETSLRFGSATGRSLGLDNLAFERRSINEGADESFDYIICTGVVHHTAEPVRALSALVGALHPEGVLELMVYNRFHRTQPVALQKALRLLAGGAHAHDDALKLTVAESLMDDLASDSSVMDFLRERRHEHPAQLADQIIQPVEWSYTVQSLQELAASAGAALWLPVQNSYDKAAGRTWTLDLAEGELEQRYRDMRDIDRWQLANLLLAEESPWLWFYLRPASVGRPAHLVDAIDASVLDATFAKVETMSVALMRDKDGRYVPRRRFRHPAKRPGGIFGELCDANDGHISMRDILARTGAALPPGAVGAARLALTTPLAPFLVSTAAA